MFFTPLLALLLSPVTYASVLSSTPGATSIEGITISSSVKLSTPPTVLGLVGAGLRYKKVAFIKAKVYVGELFADAPEKIVKSTEGALASLAAEKVVVLRMTFVRNVDGEKIGNGFREALEENKVKLDAAPIKQFLEAVTAGGAVKDKQSLTVIGEKSTGGKETVSYENAAGKLVKIAGDAGFVRDIFSIWLGKIDDSGLENLKDEILGLKK